MIIPSFSVKIVSSECSPGDTIITSFSPRVVKHSDKFSGSLVCVPNFSAKIYNNSSSVGDFLINNISSALAPFTLQNETFEFIPVKGKIIRRK